MLFDFEKIAIYDKDDNLLFSGYKKDFLEARKNPYIIHYCSPRKPWNMPSVEYSQIFWHYARKTPFYEEIVFENTMQNISFDQFIIPSPSPTIETAIKGLIIIAKIISTNLIAEIIPKNTNPIDNTSSPNIITIPSFNNP